MVGKKMPSSTIFYHRNVLFLKCITVCRSNVTNPGFYFIPISSSQLSITRPPSSPSEGSHNLRADMAPRVPKDASGLSGRARSSHLQPVCNHLLSVPRCSSFKRSASAGQVSEEHACPGPAPLYDKRLLFTG